MQKNAQIYTACAYRIRNLTLQLFNLLQFYGVRGEAQMAHAD